MIEVLKSRVLLLAIVRRQSMIEKLHLEQMMPRIDDLVTIGRTLANDSDQLRSEDSQNDVQRPQITKSRVLIPCEAVPDTECCLK